MSEIHSVVFVAPSNSKDRMWWLNKHQYKPIKRVHIVKKDGVVTQYRYRLRDPDLYKRFSTKVIFSPVGEIHLILGYKR